MQAEKCKPRRDVKPIRETEAEMQAEKCKTRRDAGRLVTDHRPCVLMK